MSSVIRPAGPLPSRVYWVRRLLLLVVLVTAFSIAWWVVGRAFGGPSEPAADGMPGQSPPDTSGADGGGLGNSAGGSGSGSGHGFGRGGHDSDPRHGGHERGDKQGHGDGKRDHEHQVPAAPTGECAPSEVGMRVGVDDAKPGESAPVTLEFTSLDPPACTLAITPDTLVLRITSGDDVVWSSDDCPDELLAKELVVRARTATAYRFEWDGTWSTGSCSAPGDSADEGSYRAEAALIGATTHTASFDLR